MRLVSQHGNVDIPYEQAIIAHRQEEVVAIVGDREYTMGKYTSMKKSYKAMEMLREEYQKYYSNNGGGMMAAAEFYVQPFAFNHPKVFQFPKDEEIEV